MFIHVLRLWNDNLKIFFAASTNKPQLVEPVRKSWYGQHSATLGGVPNMNHNSYSRHKINTSPATTYDCSIEWIPSIWATTRTLTPVTQGMSNVHAPSRATTQGMPFRATTQEMSFWATTQGMPHVYPPSRATTQGMFQQSPSSRYHPKPYRPHTSKETSHTTCKTLNLLLHMKPLFQAYHTNTWPWTQDKHSYMNLPARGPASMNLPAHSPTLWTSPSVVQHTWSKSYEPPHS